MFVSGDKMDSDAGSYVNEQSDFGFDVKVGKEYRKSIVDNLEMRFGADLAFKYSHSQTAYNDKTANDFDSLNERTTYQPGVNLVFGFNYLLGENLLVGAELLPSFIYITGESILESEDASGVEEIKSDISGFNYGLSNTSVLLSIAYKL